MSLKEVIKNALANIQKEGKALTPSEFKQQFCFEAKKANLKTDECNELQSILSKVDADVLKRLNLYNAKTLEDLVNILLAAYKRSEGSESKEITKSYETLIVSLLNALKASHDKNMQLLARETQTKIDSALQSSQINALNERWQRALKEKSDGSFGVLRELLGVANDDIENVAKKALELLKHKSVEMSESDLESLLTLILVPSLSKHYDIADVLNSLKKSEGRGLSEETRSVIKTSVATRIELDVREAQKSAREFNELVGIVSSKLLGIVEKNKVRSEKIRQIKSRIQSMVSETNKAEEIKIKLLEVTDSIEGEIKVLNTEIEEKESEINSLKRKVDELEVNLIEAKKEASIDFLTKVMSKKSLLDELERIEAVYARHQKDYAVVFFDLDFFKKINDDYGHEAGDKVLSSFGTLIKKYTRTEDIIARYGGEEFVAILTEASKKNAIEFAEHIRSVVESSKFLYKGIRLSVTLSCGVAMRSECGNKDETLRRADENLYQAKNSGRNRVVPSA